MENQNFYEVEYLYDETADILGIKVTRDFKYHETIELDEGLFLDFDEDNLPTALEIHDASKRLSVARKFLNEIIFFKMHVKIDKKSITINAIFALLVQNIENKQELGAFTSNNYNLPNLETNLVTV